jgi:CARDB
VSTTDLFGNLSGNPLATPVPNTLFGQTSLGQTSLTKTASPIGSPFGSSNLPDLVARFEATTKDGKTEIVVTNQGSQKAQGQIDIAVYASKDPFLDAADGQIALLKKQTVNWAAGQSKTYGVNNLPKQMSGQDFFQIASVDTQNAIQESDEGNNLAVWNTAPSTVTALAGGLAARSLSNAVTPANSTLRKTVFWNNTKNGENVLWYTDGPD